jgi:hypothetical protein
MINKLHYIIIPLFLDLISLLVIDRCANVICLFPGRGFPLGFYNNSKFYFIFFLVNFIFWVIFYFIFVKVVKIFIKKYQK